MATTTRAAADTLADTPRIVRDPKILGGEPTVRGTRVPVRSIVISNARYGGNLEQVCRAFSLDPETVKAALAFYEANRSEIDWHIRENELAALRARPNVSAPGTC